MTIQDSSQTSKKILAAALTGNVLEWYDFSLYGYFAPILSKLFFPSSSIFISLLAAYGIFAAGFVMRPLGAILFGYYGDLLGRKKMLMIAVMLMALPTTCIGILPTYAHTGLLAAVLLTVCRLVQGLAVGGEVSGSMVYVMEHSPVHRRGFYSSCIVVSGFIALLLSSSIVSLLNHNMSQSALESWGWRLPFLAGLLLGFFGLYLRASMPETPNFLIIKQTGDIAPNPILHVCKNQTADMVKILCLEFLPAMAFYLLFIYFTSYMHVYLNFSMGHVVLINTTNIVLVIIVLPLVGMLSDKTGKRILMIIGAIGFCLLSYPMFLLISTGSLINAFLGQACLSLLLCFTSSSIPAIMAEMFSTNIRFTGLALPYNLANAIFGGTAPLIATFLIGVTGSLHAPSYSLVIASIIMLITLLFVKEIYLGQKLK